MLAGLRLELVANRQGHATIGEQGASPWLLPGGRPGQPISAAQLNERLHRLGVRPGQARSTAAVSARHRPAGGDPGPHARAAHQRRRGLAAAASGVWTGYAAEVSRRQFAEEHRP